MTPDAVIHRYLQLTSQQDVAVDTLCQLLSADADLLARWLKLLNLPAEFDSLRTTMNELTVQQISQLATAQITNVLPYHDSARLSFDQWVAVLKAAVLGEVIATALAPDTLPSGRLRMVFLLAISGVHLPQDTLLTQLSSFRGVKPQLLAGTSLYQRIFAVVDGLEFGREFELAQSLLELNRETLSQYILESQQQVDDLLDKLGLSASDDVDWSFSFWVHQQLAQFSASTVNLTSLSELYLAHQRFTRSLFNVVPLIFYVSNGQLRQLAPEAHSENMALDLDNEVSQFIQCWQAQAKTEIADETNTPVVDRQILRQLGCTDGILFPIGGSTAGGSKDQPPVGVALFAADEDLDLDVIATQYCTRIAQPLGYVGEAHNSSKEQSEFVSKEHVEAFRTLEQARLRELVHEANNPLSIVQNYLHILELRLQHDGQAAEQLQLIGTELKRATHIFAKAREVPEYSYRESTDSVETETPVSISLTEWLSQVCELHQGYAQQHNVNLSFSGSLHEPQKINVQTNLLHQILSNLLKNAIEACATDTQIHGVSGQVGRVVLSCHLGILRNSVSGTLIEIEDNGHGLPAAVLESLGEVQTSSKGGDHQGVGLSVVVRLAEEMAAQLDVVSHPQGTRFGLFLPNQ